MDFCSSFERSADCGLHETPSWSRSVPLHELPRKAATHCSPQIICPWIAEPGHIAHLSRHVTWRELLVLERTCYWLAGDIKLPSVFAMTCISSNCAEAFVWFCRVRVWYGIRGHYIQNQCYPDERCDRTAAEQLQIRLRDYQGVYTMRGQPRTLLASLWAAANSSSVTQPIAIRWLIAGMGGTFSALRRSKVKLAESDKVIEVSEPDVKSTVSSTGHDVWQNFSLSFHSPSSIPNLTPISDSSQQMWHFDRSEVWNQEYLSCSCFSGKYYTVYQIPHTRMTRNGGPTITKDTTSRRYGSWAECPTNQNI